MDMLKKVVCLMVLCMVLISPCAEATKTCNQVNSAIEQCLPYLTTGGVVPLACCNDVKDLNSEPKTKPDRQAVCECLVTAAKTIKGINISNANKIPGECGVKFPYSISIDPNCTEVQ